MLSSLPVLRASPSEKTCRLAMVFFSGSALSASTESTRRNALAGGLRHALTCAGLGDQRRHLRRIRQQRAAFQRDHGNAGQALEFQADLGVGSNRRRRGHRDRRIDAARAVRRQAEIRHLADANPIEQHGSADQKSRHRTIELDVIGRARTEAAGIVKPVDEAEHGDDGRQHEGADDDEGSAGFHFSARFRLQHLGALAVKIGPHPGMLGSKQFAHRSDRDDLAVRERGDAVADGIQAGEIVGDHEHR